LILRYLPILDTTSMTMKSFIAIALLALAALASAEDEVEITETRELCSGAGAAARANGVCKREILKREDCRPTSQGGSRCSGKREDEEFERVESRELCKKTASGVICGTEVLKRELCTPTRKGVRCNRLVVEGEEEEKEDVKRELCVKKGFCGRVEVEGEACSPAGKANGACKRIEAEMQEAKRELCVQKGFCGRMVAEECRPTPTAGSRCKRMEGEFEEDLEKRQSPRCKPHPGGGASNLACQRAYGPTWSMTKSGHQCCPLGDMRGREIVEVVTRDECRSGAQKPHCGREILEKRRCHPGPTGPTDCKRIEDEDHIKIEARERCHTVGQSRICNKEILKREECNVVGGKTHCNGKREEPCSPAARIEGKC